MEKLIPYEKLSKKEKRKMDLSKRQTWGELNPVTRKPQNSKAYNRNKSRNWQRDYQRTNSGTFLFKYCFQIRQMINERQIGCKITGPLFSVSVTWEMIVYGADFGGCSSLR